MAPILIETAGPRGAWRDPAKSVILREVADTVLSQAFFGTNEASNGRLDLSTP